MAQHHNILVIITHGGMGDLLLSSVLAEALHRCYPGCRVTFWAQRRFAPLLENHPYIDGLLDLDPAAPLLTKVRQVRAHRFDTALVPWSVRLCTGDVMPRWRQASRVACAWASKCRSRSISTAP